MSKRPRIEAWSINVLWNDGSEDVITEVPNYVARDVDHFLTGLEDEKADDEGYEEEETPKWLGGFQIEEDKE